MTHWVPVEGFPGYSVNPLGQVRNDDSGRLLVSRINQYGVPYVGLMRNSVQLSRSLPLLVAKAFVPQPSPYFRVPINLNGDRLDCRVENLDWRPRHYAVKYVRQFIERYESPINTPVRAREDGDVFPDSLAAACRYGLLEEEVVLSILNNTVAWPTYQAFELAE